MPRTTSADQGEEALMAIRKRYTEIMREILAASDTLPDWVFNPVQACECGDKCGTGTTRAGNLLDQIVNPAKGA